MYLTIFFLASAVLITILWRQEQYKLFKKRIDQQFDDATDQTQETLKNNHPKPFYNHIDLMMKQVPSVCGVDCSSCCHQPVDLFHQEISTIAHFLQNKLTVDDQNFVINNANAYIYKYNLYYQQYKEAWQTKVQHSSDDVESLNYFITIKFYQTPLPCPYLKNRRCLIYPVRPIRCRTYSVNFMPSLCHPTNIRNASEKAAYVSHKTVELFYALNGDEEPKTLVSPAIEAFDLIQQYGYE